MTYLNKVHFGDCLETLRGMPDGIVNTCVTSPPYFGLRSYFPDAVSIKKSLSDSEKSRIRAELLLLGVKAIDDTFD